MKLSILALFLGLFPFFSHASDVLVFTDADFESNVKQHAIILIEFYAPWCGHCKKLAPEYEVAATTLKKHDLSIAKVDCTVETKTCEKYGVSGYPTLKVFKGGEFAMEYSAERSADGIVKFMISKSGPSARELKSVADAEKFFGSDDPVIAGFFSSAESDMEKALKSTADVLNEDFRFSFSLNKDIIAKYGKSDKIILFRPTKMQNKFEETQVVYSGSATQSEIKSWIEQNAMGLAGVRSSSTSKFFEAKPLIVAYYNVDYIKDPKGTNYIRNRLMKVGKKLMDAGKKMTIGVSSSKDMSFELNEFGVETPDDKAVYVTAKDEKNQKFKMDAEFSMETFEKFLNDLFAGALTPYLKSEPVPASNDEPVKVIVAKNFDEIVNDPTKDVLIEFYAPWCGHCKSLAPKYDELATKLKDEKDIVIAKMDATANDVPSQYEVRGFPTIYFAPKNSKMAPKQYSMGREVDEFIKYLAKESTDPMSLYDRNGSPKKIDL